LIRRNSGVTILPVPHTQQVASESTVHTAVHRFDEFIGGRSYLIEVAALNPTRWRAYIVRMPGVPTALMPFYGATPEEAAAQLRRWLERAHARAATSAIATSHT
jgi:hypothetical protein